jgi:hypothetical protein
MPMLQVHRVILILAQSQCDRNTTAVLVLFAVQKHGSYLYELYGFQRHPQTALPSSD